MEGTDLWDKNGFLAGDEAMACGRDYRFVGTVVAVFWTLGGKKKYAVENADRVIKIFAKHELVKVSFSSPTPDLQEKGERVKRERK